MRYYRLKNIYDEYDYIKTNYKIDSICKRMAKLCQLHANLDRQLIKELSRLNNLCEDEISDILSSTDFLVDRTPYGLNEFTYEEISKEEFLNRN